MAARRRTSCACLVIPRPRRGRGNPFSWTGYGLPRRACGPPRNDVLTHLYSPFRLIWGPFPRRGGACPSRRFCTVPFGWGDFAAGGRRAPFGAIQKGRKDRRGWPRRPLWAANDGHPRTPIYGGAWFGGVGQMYRRGVASDTPPFSRPLPLCGIGQRNFLSTRLNAPPLVLPRGAVGIG